MNNFEYFAPRSLKEAFSLLDKFGQKAKVLAGGTDLIAQMKMGRASPTNIIDIKNIQELNCLELSADGTLHIGATVPISKVIEFPPVMQKFVILHQACSLIGSNRIRNRGTVGGNVCNAAPSADSSPALICLKARAIAARAEKIRKIPFEEFFLGPGYTALEPGELLVEIEIPPTPPSSAGCYLRHTPREEMDIAVAGVASFLVLAPESIVCQEVRIALGAVASTPIRAPKAEALLKGKIPTKAYIEKAAEAAAMTASPISDVRSSAEYRRELVKVLTRRSLTQTFAAFEIKI